MSRDAFFKLDQEYNERQERLEEIRAGRKEEAPKTPAELSLEQALTEGMHAGLTNRAASLNPYQSETPEHAEWERGRMAATSQRVAGSFC